MAYNTSKGFLTRQKLGLPMDFETLKERVTYALAMTPGLTQAGLARACGISRPSVNGWFIGKTLSIDGKYLTAAASYLKVDPHWLSTGLGPIQPTGVLARVAMGLETEIKFQNPYQDTIQNTVNLSSGAVVVVPHLQKDEAGMYQEFLEGKRSPQSDPEVWAAPAGMSGMQAFSVTVDDDVMEPLLPKGCRAIIGVGVPHQSGDKVFVKSGNSWMIRRLIIDGDTLYLDTPRTQAKPITGEIVGPVVSVNIPTMNLEERLKTK